MTSFSIAIDGASKGNPGAAGIGVVLCDDAGNLILEISEYIGETTNNVAEYTALIRGLEEALKLGAESIRIST
ncbi:MAG TPA: reverse transcriptase-like protein, partial [Armatimonadota bacterium]|nr:reverse transcriptase-like protein [Armatimonadota bacterium]